MPVKSTDVLSNSMFKLLEAVRKNLSDCPTAVAAAYALARRVDPARDRELSACATDMFLTVAQLQRVMLPPDAFKALQRLETHLALEGIPVDDPNAPATESSHPDVRQLLELLSLLSS